jgi:hypothetical protein
MECSKTVGDRVTVLVGHVYIWELTTVPIAVLKILQAMRMDSTFYVVRWERLIVHV